MVGRSDDSHSRACRRVSMAFKKLAKAPATEQVLVGTASGWATGYVLTKFGKYAAVGLGTSIIILQLAIHKQYVTVDWDGLDEATRRAKERAEKLLYGEGGAGGGFASKAKQYVKENVIFVGAFTAGFLFGVGSA